METYQNAQICYERRDMREAKTKEHKNKSFYLLYNLIANKRIVN
jgi:hypothetical protein